jgi:hypothetical protein
MKSASVGGILSLVALAAVAGAPTTAKLSSMRRLEKEAIEYFWTQSNQETGVTRDRAPNAPGSTTPNSGPGGWYDQCNKSATGYALGGLCDRCPGGFP